MILSLAISYLIGNGGSTSVPAPTSAPAGVETPAPAGSATDEAKLTPTAEPTEAN